MVEARAKATAIQATPELINDPEAFDKFQKAQGELSGALSRLLVVAEQYPNLRANQAFQDLRVALEGTENRITVARNRYVQTVADYNVKARSFPTNLTAMMFGYKVKPNFTVQNEAQISVPPTRQLRQGRVGAALIAAFVAHPGPAMRSFVAAVLLVRRRRPGARRRACCRCRRSPAGSSTRPATLTPAQAEALIEQAGRDRDARTARRS